MQPLSPLDGRYAKQTDLLRPFFTEDALMRARILVELRYLEALGDEKKIPELKPFSPEEKQKMQGIVDNFDEKEAAKIREIEKTTNHDVKAIEYYLRTKLAGIAGRSFKSEFIHFALTSEDVNNLSYGILIHDGLKKALLPELKALLKTVRSLASANKNRQMLSLTHGQPATPTTLGKEMAVFADRLERQITALASFRMQGKFGGAVGNYFAHRSAYPDLDWESFGKKFVKSLGIRPIQNATQINPHDDVAELSHAYIRVNTILLDCCRDIWSYISRGVFVQRVIAGEVGSSTMPHKVNPIDFENAEGNLGLSSALFDHFALKLPISRLQRDLSDSTVQRNFGVAFGYHILALASMKKGFGKLLVNTVKLREELSAHPEVLTEAIQTVMRKNGMSDAYEQMKALSRGKPVTLKDLQEFVKHVAIAEGDRKRLLALLS